MATMEAATPHSPWKRRFSSKTIGSTGGTSERAEKRGSSSPSLHTPTDAAVDRFEGSSLYLGRTNEAFSPVALIALCM